MKRLLHLYLFAALTVLISLPLLFSASASAECPHPGGHSFTNYVNNHDATCLENETRTAKCDYCDETDTEEIEDSLAPHTYETVAFKGSFNKTGYKYNRCTFCGKRETVEKYPAVTSVYVPQDWPCIYDKTAKEPPVVLETDEGKKLAEGEDYTVTYKNNVNVGTAKAQVTLKGNYSGTKEVDFDVCPGEVENVNIRYDGSKSIITWDAIPGVETYFVELSNHSEDVPTAKKRVKTNSAQFDYLFPETLYELYITPEFKNSDASEFEFITPSLEYDSVEYNGTEFRPTVDFGETVDYVENEDYTVTYLGNRSVGFGVAKISFKDAAMVSFDLIFRILPQKVKKLTVGSTATDGLSLSWPKVAGAKQYMIYQSTDGESWKRVSAVKTNSANIKSLVSGQSYQYKVRAYADSGYGSYSPVLKTQTRTSSPKNLQVQAVSTTSVKLSWNAVFGAVTYEVYQSSNGKSWKKAATVKGANATIRKLSAGKKYQFKVLSTGLAGKSAFSSVLKTQTLTVAPSVKLTSPKAKTAKASWKTVPGAKEYIVYRSSDGKRWKKLSVVSKTSVTVSKLTSGKKLYVRVIAVNSYAKKSAKSAVKSVKVK